MKRLRPAHLLYLVAILAFGLDRVSKLLASHLLAGRASVRVVPGVLSLTYTTNTGGAFGLFTRLPWLFAAATVVVSAVIVATSRSVSGRLQAVALGLILGGAIGNLVDRLAGGWSLSGDVVDFIDFRVWPVFNIADSVIVVGAGLLLVYTVRRRKA